MDDSVLAAIARWPNVPNVYGWLSLDRRGKWRLQGSPIDNPHITEFIGRNYERDERGAWFFQNGPQRVYVQLDYTPWVLRIGDAQSLTMHTGAQATGLREALLDDHGNLLIAFDESVGLIEDRDLPALIDMIVDANGKQADDAALSRLMNGEPLPFYLQWANARLPLAPIHGSEVAWRFGFVADPQPEK